MQMEDTLGRIGEYLGTNLPLSLVSQNWYQQLDTVERYDMEQVMNRYSQLQSLLSVAIQAVYNNDSDTIITLARTIPRGIDWNRVSTHVNEKTDRKIISTLSHILGRGIHPNLVPLPDIYSHFGIATVLSMIRDMRETSDKDFANLERLIYMFPEISTLSAAQLNLYYNALARALIFGWVSIFDGRINRDNIINVFARITTPTIHRLSRRFLDENNLHSEWFVDAINPYIRRDNIPPSIWKRLLPTAISVRNTSLAVSMIKKFRNQITDEMKNKILDLVATYDVPGTRLYIDNL